MKADEGRTLTDAELDELEKRIIEMYGEAAENLAVIIDEYFAEFQLRDEEMQKLIGTEVNGREWTEADYTQWRLAQMGRGERFEALRDKLAKRLTDANEVAISYINDATPGIYTLNRNYAAYEVSDAGGDFTLYDEQTVRRLIVEQPDLMPYYPEAKAVKRGIDLAFGKKQITKSVTSGILMGSSTSEIAANLRKYIVNMSAESAIRAARTAVTAAENGGRQASYEKAAAMGIEMEREWMATKDARTRPEHGAADGQRVAVDEPFIVGGQRLMTPGDTSHGASGWNIYNCRCCVRAVVKGHGRKRETYAEWLGRMQDTDNAEYLRNDLPHGYVDTRSVGNQITQESLEEIISYANSKGVQIGVDGNPTGNFDKYCGDPQVLRNVIDDASAAISSSLYKKTGAKGVVLMYDNVLGYNGNSSVVDTGAFAMTKGRTITLNKFMFDDSAFLISEYKAAAESGIFVRGTSYRNIIAHEAGHIIEKNTRGLYQRVLTALEEESNLRELPIDVYLTNSLSGIAAVKDRRDGTFHELIAEINSVH